MRQKSWLPIVTFNEPLILVRDLSPTVVSVVEKLCRDCHDMRWANIDGIEHVRFVLETVAYKENEEREGLIVCDNLSQN